MNESWKESIELPVNKGGDFDIARENVYAHMAGQDSEAMRLVAEKLDKLPPEIKDALGEEERQLLSLLGQKDKSTLEHSLAVSEICWQQLGEFKNDLAQEGVSERAYIEASALHDIGKLFFPDAVLKGTITTEQFREKFYNLKDTDPSFIDQRLHERGILPQNKQIKDVSDEEIKAWELDYRDFVTMEQCYGDKPEAMEEIKNHLLNPSEMSFMDALRIHEDYSRDMIINSNIPEKAVVAELAGSHHHYAKKGQENHPVGSETLRMSVVASELLHLSDVFQAIIQKRTYQERHSPVGALYIIMNESRRGIFKVDIAKRWLKRASSMINDVRPEEKQMFAQVQDFIGS